MICYTVYKPTSNICRSSVPLSLREDVGPWVRLQWSFSPQPLLFCLQMPSNNSDKNSLPSLTKNKSLIFSKFCQALFRVRSDLAVIPQLSADLPAVPSLPAPKGKQKCWVSTGIQPALQSRLPGCAPWLLFLFLLPECIAFKERFYLDFNTSHLIFPWGLEGCGMEAVGEHWKQPLKGHRQPFWAAPQQGGLPPWSRFSSLGHSSFCRWQTKLSTVRLLS